MNLQIDGAVGFLVGGVVVEPELALTPVGDTQAWVHPLLTGAPRETQLLGDTHIHLVTVDASVAVLTRTSGKTTTKNLNKRGTSKVGTISEAQKEFLKFEKGSLWAF